MICRDLARRPRSRTRSVTPPTERIEQGGWRRRRWSRPMSTPFKAAVDSLPARQPALPHTLTLPLSVGGEEGAGQGVQGEGCSQEEEDSRQDGGEPGGARGSRLGGWRGSGVRRNVSPGRGLGQRGLTRGGGPVRGP